MADIRMSMPEVKESSEANKIREEQWVGETTASLGHEMGFDRFAAGP